MQIFLVFSWLAAIWLIAQPTPSRKFEVASIHENPGPFHVLKGYSISGPRLTLEAYSVMDLVQEAYQLKPYQVTAVKAVMPSAAGTRYNVRAEAEAGSSPTAPEFSQMLQALLAERFNLQFHHEARLMRVYALVVGKSGPRFKESAPDAVFSSRHGIDGRNQNITAVKVTMGDLAEYINGDYGVDRPVLNETGLTGRYDIKLEATPEYLLRSEQKAGEVSVFTAVKEMLGLKLEPQKADVDVLVVDRIEKPSAN